MKRSFANKTSISTSKTARYAYVFVLGLAFPFLAATGRQSSAPAAENLSATGVGRAGKVETRLWIAPQTATKASDSGAGCSTVGRKVIVRIWHGYTKPQDADTYEQFLLNKMLPSIRRIKGYQGAYTLRAIVGDEVEFTTHTVWESMDAIREFVNSDHPGADFQTAVVPEEPKKWLKRFDQKVKHYEAVWCR